MDQVLAQAKIEVSATLKAWEPQRAYEKRLTTAMSKEKGSLLSPLLLVCTNIVVIGTTRKVKGKNIKSAAGVTTDEEPSDGEGLGDHDVTEPSRAKRRSGRLRGVGTTEPQGQDEMGQTADEEEPQTVPEPLTPKTRPRPKPTHKNISPIPPPMEDDHELPVYNTGITEDFAIAVDEEPVVNGTEVTPKPSLKRTRPDDDEQIPTVEESGPGTTEMPSSIPDDGDIRIRKKRVRH